MSNLKITDIRIGDTLQDKESKSPMRVVASFEGDLSDEGTVYMDFEGNEGDLWEEDIRNLERVKPIKR